MGIHMAALPEKAAAIQISSKPSPFVSGSPCHYSTCYRSSGRPRMFKPMLGNSFLAALILTEFAPVTGAFEDVQSYSSGPHEPRVGLDCPFVLAPLIFPLPHLRRRLCVCASFRLDMFSLSLSHYYLSLSQHISLSS
jgi:hypothetical protein